MTRTGGFMISGLGSRGLRRAGNYIVAGEGEYLDEFDHPGPNVTISFLSGRVSLIVETREVVGCSRRREDTGARVRGTYQPG